MLDLLVGAVLFAGFLILIGGAIFVAVHLMGLVLAVAAILMVGAVAYFAGVAAIGWWRNR